MQPSLEPKMRKEDYELLSSIYDALTISGRRRALEYHSSKNISKLTDLRDDGKDWGDWDAWEGYYILDYGNALYRQFRPEINEKTKENKFDAGFKKNKLEHGRSFLQNIPSAKSTSKQRSEAIFRSFADIQDVSLIECLLNFLEFCEEKCFQLEVFRDNPSKLGITIDDIRAHIDPSYIRTRFPDEAIKAPISSSQSIPLRFPIFIDKEQSQANDEINLNPLDHHSIPLIGRTEQLSELNRFLKAEQKGLRVLAVIAPSGAGKTRLVTEWMHRHVDKSHWDCGLVEDSDPLPWQEWQPSKNTLIVIDYVYRFDAVIHAIMKQSEKCTGFHIRLIVIDHVFPERLEELPRFDHFTSALAEDAKEVDRRKMLFHPPMYLEKLPDRLPMLLKIISHVSGERMDSKNIEAARSILIDIATGEDDEHSFTASAYPLFAILIGEAMNDPKQSISQWKRYDVIRFYLDNKRRIPWATGRNIDEEHVGKWAGAFVCAATIRRGVSYRILKKALISSEPLKPHEVEKVTSWCSRIVSSAHKQWLKPFEPDILGENFLLLFLKYAAYETHLRKVFFDCLCTLETVDKQGDWVNKYVEFVQRLARNLANDNQDNMEAEENWHTLADFLNPENYPDQEFYKFAVSAANMKVANVLKLKAETKFISLFYVNTCKKTLFEGIDNQHYLLATEAFFYLFELSTEPQRKDQRFQDGLLTVAQNFQRRSESNPSPIYQASFLNCKHATKHLSFRLKPQINVTNSEGVTPILAASSLGYADIVDVLIEAKAQVNVTTESGVSALMQAAFNGHDTCLQRLIEAKAKLNVTNNDGWTALMYASLSGSDSCVRRLIDAKAQLNVTNEDGFSALMLAAQTGHDTCLQSLIEAKAQMNVTTENGVSALMLAAFNGHDTCLQRLIEAKVKVDVTTDEDWTALMLAAQNGHDICVWRLIEASAKLNVANEDNYTALMLAAQNGHYTCLQFLIEAKAQVNLTTEYGASALMLAALSGHDTCLQRLIEAKAQVNDTTADGTSALMVAVRNGHDTLLQRIMEANTQLNVAYEDRYSALMRAEQSGRDICVKHLIEAKANVNLTNEDGFSALMLAAQNGHDVSVRRLIEAKAKINVTNEDGWTALMLAEQNGHDKCVQLLIEAKAQVNITNEDG